MEEEHKKKSNNKIWIGILIALIFLGIGFYLYYFYPQVIPGMASISQSLKDDINILVIGLDDLESVNKGVIEADSLILLKLKAEEGTLDLVSIIKKDSNIISEDIDISKEELANFTNEIGEYTSSDIDYYFTISYQGFENLINNLDGIEIELAENLRVPDLNLDLQAGLNGLTGEETLNYARWYDYKKDENDRIERQQQVIGAIIEKAFQMESFMDLPQFITTSIDVYKLVKTNIDYSLITEITNYINQNRDLKINYSVYNLE